MKLEGFSKYEIYPYEQRVWSYKRNKFLAPKQTSRGYMEYSLYGDDNKRYFITAHKLFWKTVNGDIPDGYEINHIDEDKTNNNLSNLNLLTHSENNNWGTRNERAKNSLINGKRSKPILAIKDKTIIHIFPSLKETRRQGYNDGAICSCIKGRKYHHKGFEWKYVEDYLSDWWDMEMEKVVI